LKSERYFDDFLAKKGLKFTLENIVLVGPYFIMINRTKS